MNPLTVPSTSTAPRSADLFDPAWKRFQPATTPHEPLVALDAEGTILHLSESARTLLEYRKKQEIEPCFFTHVHGRNLYQVMRDIADMVCYGRHHATWLVRLRTGQGRWRWFKASVRNALDREQGAILIQLSDLYDW